MDQESLKAQFMKAYDMYADELYRFCFFKISQKERAEDMVQEVFIEYWQALTKGTHIKTPRAFLYTIARNRVIDWYRRKKSVSLDVITDQGIEFSGDVSESVTISAEFAEVFKALDILDDHSREAVILRFIEGWSPQEIAVLSNETPNVISVRLNRSIKKLQEHLRITPTT